MDAQYSHVVPKKEKSQQNTDTQHLASSTGTILTSFSLNVVRCPIDDVVLIDLLLLGHVSMLGWTFRRTFVKFNDGQKLGKSFLGSLCALWGLKLSERAFKVKVRFNLWFKNIFVEGFLNLNLIQVDLKAFLKLQVQSYVEFNLSSMKAYFLFKIEIF